MQLNLKPLADQILVITGASSGIGLVTARMAARRGARVVLAARNERQLAQAVDRIRAAGGQASFCVTDVSDPIQIERLVQHALATFGRIDTWVNNAAVGVFGRLREVSLADMRRQFDVNYWGAVHGSLAAVPHLARQGGVLINVGSTLASRALPLQGNDAAAKHALKGFSDTLRMELESEGLPVSVCLIKPGSVDTPFFEKARSYLGTAAQPMPPVYAPEAVATTILACAERPHREIVVGGVGAVMLGLTNALPQLADRYADHLLTGGTAPRDQTDNLYEPVADDGGERGTRWKGHTARRSLYASAMLNPRGALIVAASAGIALIETIRRFRRMATASD